MQNDSFDYNQKMQSSECFERDWLNEWVREKINLNCLEKSIWRSRDCQLKASRRTDKLPEIHLCRGEYQRLPSTCERQKQKESEENSLKIHPQKFFFFVCRERKESFWQSLRLLILLYGLLGRHMAAGIKSVGGRAGVNVESRLDAHAKRHHRA